MRAIFASSGAAAEGDRRDRARYKRPTPGKARNSASTLGNRPPRREPHMCRRAIRVRRVGRCPGPDGYPEDLQTDFMPF